MRAWRGYEGFEQRASLRTWLYRIATNVCLDMLNSRKRRAPAEGPRSCSRDGDREPRTPRDVTG